MKRAKLGDRVRVQCLSGTNTTPPKQGGTARQVGRKALEFTVGGHEVIRGISLGVVGMASGERRRLKLQPKDAYGHVRRKLIRKLPRAYFPTDAELHAGKRVTLVGITSRRRLRVQILDTNAQTVVVDSNHPLAGKILDLEVLLVSLNTPSGGTNDSPPDGGDEA